MAAKKKAAKGSRKKATRKGARKSKTLPQRKKTAHRKPSGAAFADADLPGDESAEND